MPKLFAVHLVVVALWACTSVTVAQERPRDPYLAGVSAYNAGDHETAAEQLTTAIEESPQDPRGYYFRGLAKLALGERAEGTDDLRQAATLELAGGWAYASIDRALATVQGPARTTVEQVRREVRLAAERIARSEPARQRRAAWEAEEKKVLRTRTELPIEALVNQLTPDQALAAASKSQGAVEEFVASAEEPAAVVAGSTAEANPFADEPNPFDQDPAAEMPEPGPVVVTQPDDSPFTDDPFLQPGPSLPRANPPAGAAPGAGPKPEDLVAGAARSYGAFQGQGGFLKSFLDGITGRPPSLPGAGDGFGPPNAGGFGPPGGGFAEDPAGGFPPPADDAFPFGEDPGMEEPGMNEEEPSPFDSPEAEGDEASPFDAAPEDEDPMMEGGADASPFDAPN